MPTCATYPLWPFAQEAAPADHVTPGCVRPQIRRPTPLRMDRYRNGLTEGRSGVTRRRIAVDRQRRSGVDRSARAAARRRRDALRGRRPTRRARRHARGQHRRRRADARRHRLHRAQPRTYPTLLRLFAELGVATQESDMSMSISCDGLRARVRGRARPVRACCRRCAPCTKPRYLRDARARWFAFTASRKQLLASRRRRAHVAPVRSAAPVLALLRRALRHPDGRRRCGRQPPARPGTIPRGTCSRFCRTTGCCR